MGDDSEWLKLPTDEKVQHKLWKARLAGYEEVIKLFQTLADEKSPEFYKYLGLVKKFVIDGNAIAQEKGLEATLAFVENAAIAGKAAGEVCSGVVAKCLNQRAKTKDLGVAILMAFIEAEKQEIVQDELMKGLANKQPKIVAVCVVALREALRDFGTKIISIKPILKQLQALLEDRDKTVRDETKQLAVEIYRWIGPALKPQLTNLKPLQVTELESEFEKLPPGKPQQTRFLRSQQDLKAKMLERAAAGAEEASADDVDDGASAAPDVDPYELIDPVDILSKLPKDFYEKVEEKKWQERREALEAVQKLAEAPKLEQGDYSDLLRALKKVVAKDSNVMLVTMAAKCIALLATGLRKKFGPHAVGCIEVLIEKFREKKVSVVQTLKEAIDACYVSTNLEAIGEACVAALDHKTPSVKAETASFLARCFAKCTPASLPKKTLKLYIAPLLKAVNDSAGEVREAAFDALGTAMKVITEKAMMPFLPDVDNLKMAKIKESCEKAVVVGKGGAPKAAAGEGSAPPKAPSAPKAVAAPGNKGGAKPPAKKGPDSAPASSASQSTAAGKKKPGTAAGKGKKNAADVKEEVMERELSDETVEEKMAELFPNGELAGLDNANWKERLSAVEKMTEVVKRMPRDDIPTQAFVRTIAKKPGYKDNNFQVLKLKVELITFLALNSQFTKRSTQFCLTELMEKISDAKNGSHVQDALSAIAEATSLDFVALQVVQFAFEQKNPKNQSESLNWLATAIKQFGFKVTVGPLMETIRKALAATNPAVRTSAITLLGIMYMYMGAALRVLFESEKPALLQQIDAEFDKVKGEKAPVPTRGIQPAGEAAEEAEDGEEGGSGDAGQVNLADLIPRTDISERMTEALMDELADKNWKLRKEGLEKVQAILNEAKFITANVGPLPEALKLRLNDSNKILVTATLAICQMLATSIGPNCKQHVRAIGPGLISNLGDTKPAIRQQAVSALNAWLEQTGMLVFVEAEMFSDALKLENPNLRAELLGWLAEKLPPCKKLPVELQECIPHLFACMEDRNADVRKKAQEALLPFMIHTGYDAMVRHAGKLKPASKDPVIKALEAARQNLPQKQPKAPAPSQPVSIKGGGGAAKAKAPVKVDYDEDEPDDGDSRPSSTAGSKTAVKGKGKPNGGGAAGTAAPAAGKKGAVAGNSGGGQGKKKGQEEEDTSPALKVSNGKEQRFKDEKNLKVLKWNFTTPRPEFIELLKQQMEPTFNRTVIDQLFHVDFKFQIRAMDTLIKLCEAGPEATIANLDLLLKWVTLRFFDTNTTLLMKALEFLQVVFNALAAEDYHLQEIEAVSFIPYLVNKVGDPKDNIRRDVHIILQLICKVYPSSKLFNYLLEGVKSKNSKQRTECLEELGCLITSYGINVCQPSPAVALRFIAQQISDRDNSVRSAALNTIVAAHSILGENVFKYVGALNEKDQSMLDERIKRSAKTRPAGVAPPVGGGGAALPPNARMSPDEKPKPTKALASTMTKAAEPRNAMPAVSRSKGQFQLDFEEIDMSDNYVMPQLLEPDLNEILDEPVKLPVTRMRPPSPAIKLLHNSADAKSAVDLVISQIASNDLTTSLQALRQLDEVLKDSEKSEALHEHVDHFLIACTLQLRVTYSKHMSENAMNREVIRLYRCLLATLISLCKCSSLVREATRDVLKDLIYNLITILLDNRLNDIEDGQEVIRAVNVTVVKVVEQADVTNIMSALIKLLHETVGIETCSPQFLELVMKCLWKMVRMLPAIVNDLNLDRVIADMNQFLKAFPSYTWKNKSSDMPLRTIKTILHSLAKIKGNRILSHLTLIDHNDHSEVESYLRKVLRTSSDTEMVSTANTRNEQLNGGIENASSAGISLTTEATESGQRSPRRISRTVHDTLADIFKKIGSKENTREGLNNLYDFKLRHPDADLDPFLKKSSQFFQDYIERGLKSIAQEREGKLKAPGSTSSSSLQSEVTSTATVSVSNDNRSNNATIDVSAAEYMERLKVLRARCGLDNSNLDSGSNPRTDSTSSSESVGIRSDTARMQSSNITSSLPSQLASGTSSTQDGPSASDAPSSTLNLEELKKRLNKIKTARRD